VEIGIIEEGGARVGVGVEVLQLLGDVMKMIEIETGAERKREIVETEIEIGIETETGIEGGI
jgi:hypothetical protein